MSFTDAKDEIARAVAPQAADEARAPAKLREHYGFVHRVAAGLQAQAGAGERPRLKDARVGPGRQRVEDRRPDQDDFRRRNGHGMRLLSSKTNKTDDIRRFHCARPRLTLSRRP